MSNLNLRLPDDLHTAAAAEAEAAHLSLNSAICDALRAWVAARALSRREDAILDRVMKEDADLLEMIRRAE
ncbi:toxin-antitoxin system HicB family antitoxin [Nocardia sp. NBC_01503]|uniref:toxin-antitoxin system HicB family antitoxin n=1 Tax=Nocardia sp. NBC_01503 TaxID=2975997 RepID=UPI002E7B6023|nr:toxin-antitoxin system HicB family antitoxin [Nocardia sp. NBC_01503]WTL32337.1 toxin-antitoxin system HicB family antitoxin [Nocardia sp. NBC_01503]